MNLPPLPLAPLPALGMSPVPLAPLALPKLPDPRPWHRSPDTNPTRPDWYVTRWRAEFPESRLYWDGVWWCVEIDNQLQRVAHINIKNWSCEWRT